MKYLVLFYILTYGCMNDIELDRTKTINSMLEYIKSHNVNDSIFNTDLLSKSYFSEDENYAIYLLIFEEMKKDILKAKSIEIIPYSVAKMQDDKIYELTSNQEDVLIIQFKNSELLIYKRIYCLMKGRKIRSLSVIRKGNYVIGWQ